MDGRMLANAGISNVLKKRVGQHKRAGFSWTDTHEVISCTNGGTIRQLESTLFAALTAAGVPSVDDEADDTGFYGLSTPTEEFWWPEHLPRGSITALLTFAGVELPDGCEVQSISAAIDPSHPGKLKAA